MPDPNVQQEGQTSIKRDQEGLVEIDELFGSTGEDVQDQGLTPSEDESFGTSDKPVQDEKDDYTGLNLNQLASKLQSNLDKTKNELDKAKQKLTEREGLETLFHNIYEDPEIRRAFIAEVEPDLIKPQDPYEAVAQRLKKEFGEDFTPDDDEAKKPLTQSWRYHRRVDELLKQAESNQNKFPKSLKELREARNSQLKTMKEQLETQKKDIMTKMKWDDNTWKGFEDWGKKFNLANLATVFNYARKKGKGMQPPHLSSQSSSGPTSRGSMAEIDKFFG